MSEEKPQKPTLDERVAKYLDDHEESPADDVETPMEETASPPLYDEGADRLDEIKKEDEEKYGI